MPARNHLRVSMFKYGSESIFRENLIKLSRKILMSMFLALAACSPLSSTPVSQTHTAPPLNNVTPEVIATVLTASAQGKLVEVDGCIQVAPEGSKTGVTLLWVPDISVKKENDKIIFTMGLVTGKREDFVYQLGDTVYLSGGQPVQGFDPSQQTDQPGCPGPYWEVGAVYVPVKATEETK